MSIFFNGYNPHYNWTLSREGDPEERKEEALKLHQHNTAYIKKIHNRLNYILGIILLGFLVQF